MDKLIWKQDAINALTTYIYNLYKVVVGETLPVEDCRDAAESVIDDLPSVQSKYGKWEPYSQFYPEVNTHWVSWECSECGYMRTKGWEGTTNGRCPTAKICENCGARMERGEQHEFFK